MPQFQSGWAKANQTNPTKRRSKRSAASSSLLEELVWFAAAPQENSPAQLNGIQLGCCSRGELIWLPLAGPISRAQPIIESLIQWRLMVGYGLRQGNTQINFFCFFKEETNNLTFLSASACLSASWKNKRKIGLMGLLCLLHQTSTIFLLFLRLAGRQREKRQKRRSKSINYQFNFMWID